MAAWSQADLDAVNRAIARGEKSVQFSDRMVTYRSMDELLQARTLIAAALSPHPRTRTGVGSKGL